jgi:hypothetical protein
MTEKNILTTKTNEDSTPMTRKDFLIKSTLASLALLLPKQTKANEVSEKTEGKEIFLNPKFELMQDHNMYPGFERYKVLATEDGKEKLVGSFFNMQNDAYAKADFFSYYQNPKLFKNQSPNFDQIKQQHKKTALIVAGAYLKPGVDKKIEGVALDHGQMVGEETVN